MTKTYTFSECYRLLDVDAKTFGRWLEKAGIDPKQQISKIDNRIRYLTQDQLEQLASDHGRILSQQQEQPSTESVAPGTYKLLLERVENLSSQVERHGRIWQDLLAKLEHQAERISTLEEQLTEAQQTITTLQAPKRTTKVRNPSEDTLPEDTLPEGFIPWRPFADLHHIGHTTVHRHIQQGIVHTIKGKWKIGNAYVKDLIGAQGQRDIWIYCHENENFLTCDNCPHQIPEQPEQQAPLEVNPVI